MRHLLTLLLLLPLAGCGKTPIVTVHGAVVTIAEADPASTFTIYRGASCASLAPIAVSAVNVYVDLQAVPGVSYCYAVTATGPGGTSDFSNEVEVTIP